MGKELAKEKCTRWLEGHCCYVGEHDGEGFVIVPSWDVVNTPGFEHIVATAVGSRYNWGFDDEYDYCSDCGVILRTSADSYCWLPQYWLSEGDGYICEGCTKGDHLDEYLDHVMNHTNAVRHINTDIVHPEDIGFTLVVEDCQYGFHRGQNDDPRKVARWAGEHGLQVVFVISTGQFDTKFDVWVRKPDETGDLYISEYGEDMVLDEGEVAQIRDALLERGTYGYYHLRREFKQWPSPAEHVQAELKKAGSNFRTIHLDGSPTTEYDSFEDMCGKI